MINRRMTDDDTLDAILVRVLAYTFGVLTAMGFWLIVFALI